MLSFRKVSSTISSDTANSGPTRLWAVLSSQVSEPNSVLPMIGRRRNLPKTMVRPDTASTTKAPALVQPEPGLRDRVPVPLLPTQGAAPTARAVEDRAMVAMASAAVRDGHGQLLGHVQAGVLLDRNLPFIDKLNDIVYPEGSLPWGSRGTATLFLEDVRISTNVRLFGGEARERPFGWLKYGVLAAIGSLFLAVMVAASIVSLRWARAIFKPLEQMSRTMQRVEAGEAGTRVGPVDSRDEIGELAAHFDHLLDTQDRQTEALRRWNAQLDATVAERTQALEAAQRELVRAEKLAAIGQLTAGVAHEVNNPIAVIQGNLDLMRELLGPQARIVDAELRLIDQQVERMRLIVTQLLQFARPTEYAGYVEPLAPSEVLEGCLLLVAHLLAKGHVTVRHEFTSTRRVGVNRHELQQVLVNLLINAIQAMPGGGELTLGTVDWPDGQGVDITVADTGPGLSDELRAQMFQPFVTRKHEGTGLGLWISQSLVERYGGEIRAANRPTGGPAGAMITVALRVEPVGDTAATG
jgi:signal transduction histidine kinase